MKTNLKVTILALLVTSISALGSDSFTVEGKTYVDKASAVKAILSANHPVKIVQNRCVVLTDKLTFKSCAKPKAKQE